MTPVESFVYRKLVAETFRTLRGGHCEKCDLDHEPTDKVCDSCGDDLLPVTVYLIRVSGNDIGIECANKDEAHEIAKAWIDDFLDHPPSDEDEDDEEIEPPRPKKRRRKRQGLNQPTGPKNDELLEQVKQMGWGKKALAYLRGKGNGNG